MTNSNKTGCLKIIKTSFKISGACVLILFALALFDVILENRKPTDGSNIDEKNIPIKSDNSNKEISDNSNKKIKDNKIHQIKITESKRAKMVADKQKEKEIAKISKQILEEAQRKQREIKKTIVELTKEKIESLMLSPSSADFPWGMSDYVKVLNNGLYLIASYVDGQNAFGATIRNKFYLVWDYNEKENRYTLVELLFGDIHQGSMEEYLKKKQEKIEKEKKAIQEAELAEKIRQEREKYTKQKEAEDAKRKAAKEKKDAENLKKYGQIKSGEKFDSLEIGGKTFNSVEILKNENRTLKIKHAKGIDFVGY